MESFLGPTKLEVLGQAGARVAEPLTTAHLVLPYAPVSRVLIQHIMLNGHRQTLQGVE